MDEIHYLISDASKKVDVEAHVLRYWEEELELNIPRNEMGHRYYTELYIRLFKQVKELKEKGYQLKAIKNALIKVMEAGGDLVVSDEVLEEDMAAALKETGDGLENHETGIQEYKQESEIAEASEKRMEQFQQIMNHIIGQALEVNNEKLSQDISSLVNEKVTKELEYLIRVTDEKEEERFKQLDETIRIYQKDGRGRAEAAAARVPFFKKRRFGKEKKK